MLARNRRLRFPAARPLPGPLLIPSVSSKGFPLLSDGTTESGAVLAFASQDITEALLISAYDLHHRLLPDSEKLLSQHHCDSVYATPHLLVIDSGGYELNPYDFEGGETHRSPYNPREFTRENFYAVVDQVPNDKELLVVSYDSPERPRASYKEQRVTAQRFFADRQHLHSDFLLKPEGEDRLIDIAALTPDARNMSCFDVIGVTEKELGKSLLDRVTTAARLRHLLDQSGCAEIPIHVFGSLDPLFTTLYFMAGIEIFDGLSWLRYAYAEGLSIHPDQLAALRGTVDDRPQRRDMYRYISNLKEITALKRRLGRWVNEPDRYEHLGSWHEKLREIFESMQADLAQRG